MLLRKDIITAYNDSEPLSWPPDPNELDFSIESLPYQLKKFLCLLMYESEQPPSPRAKRLIKSIGQDLCRSVTNGAWKLPKHILLCVSLRHLFRNSNVVTILNRLGHCENNSFYAELEEAILQSIKETFSILTNKVVRGAGNLLFHSEWDNFQQSHTGINSPSMICTSGGKGFTEIM